MYNEERKLRFLSECETKYSDEYVTGFRSLFNKTQDFEEMFGKDVADFSREDISNFYSVTYYSDAYTYSNINARLGSYCSWCIEQSLVLDGCNHYREFVIADFYKYINIRLERKKYFDRDEYNKFLASIVNARDKFLVMCIYEFGKSDNFEEIFKLKMEDIKGNTATLVTGREVHLSDELIAVAHRADQEHLYITLTGDRERELIPSEYIFKKSVTSPGKGESIDPNYGNKLVARLLSSIVGYYGGYEGINASSLALSGQIDMIHRESARLGISCEEYITTHFDELKKQYVVSPDYPRKFYRKYRAYL